MSEGNGKSQPTTLIGLVATIVITIGALLEAQDIIHAVLVVLQRIVPAVASEPVALLVFVAFIALLIFFGYWLRLHYGHKPSGSYQAPKHSLNKAKKRNGRRRR